MSKEFCPDFRIADVPDASIDKEVMNVDKRAYYKPMCLESAVGVV